MSLLAIGLMLWAQSLPLWALFLQIQEWVLDLGAWGPAGFVLAYILVSAVLLPVWPLCVYAASIYGLFNGTVVAICGSTAAAGVQFLLSRYIAREPIGRRIAQHPQLLAVHQAISDGGWRIVALLRLSPILPFGLQNYFYGLTSIRFGPYLLASALALLPVDFLYVYLGYMAESSVHAFSDQAHWGLWLMELAGLALTILVTVQVSRRARRAMRKLGLAERGGKKSRRRRTLFERRARRVARPLSWRDAAWASVAVALFLTALANYFSGDRFWMYVESQFYTTPSP